RTWPASPARSTSSPKSATSTARRWNASPPPLRRTTGSNPHQNAAEAAKESVMDLIATLGLTPEELQDRIIERAVSTLLETTQYDEDGDSFTDHSPLAERLQKSVKETIDAKIAEIAEKH